VRLLWGELLKIRTAPRTTFGLVLGLLLLVGLGSAATASDAGGEFGDEMAPWDVIRNVGTIAPVFTLILGILVVTWEYRHGTITQTYLASPKREQVIGAKLAISFAAGATVAAVAIGLALVVAAFWITLDLERGQWELVGRVVLAAAIWGVLGAGLGALLQSQLGAIITAFVWFLVAEPVISGLLGIVTETSVPDYLPGNVLDRLQSTGQGIAVGSGDFPFGTDYSYGVTAAGLLAAAYASVLAVLGVLAAVRRDVP
jgi:ABC-2 type transport system permease protein